MIQAQAHSRGAGNVMDATYLCVCSLWIQGAEGGSVVGEEEGKKSKTPRRRTKSAAALEVGRPSSNRLIDNLSLKVHLQLHATMHACTLVQYREC